MQKYFLFLSSKSKKQTYLFSSSARGHSCRRIWCTFGYRVSNKIHSNAACIAYCIPWTSARLWEGNLLLGSSGGGYPDQDYSGGYPSWNSGHYSDYSYYSGDGSGHYSDYDSYYSGSGSGHYSDYDSYYSGSGSG